MTQEELQKALDGILERNRKWQAQGGKKLAMTNANRAANDRAFLIHFMAFCRDGWAKDREQLAEKTSLLQQLMDTSQRLLKEERDKLETVKAELKELRQAATLQSWKDNPEGMGR